MPLIVHQAKLQLCSTIALVGQFAVDAYGGLEIALVKSGFGFVERTRCN
jgi:hypothetical protein